ncbi:MAG: glycoside hydrolase family 3 C-terminal domain-containing protein [Acidimicrobiales bacterium]
MSASRVEQLLAELDLPERIRLLAGRDYWHTEPIERVGIGSVQLSDGPVGVRGERTTGSVSVSFPCGTAIGATFDRSAAAALGDVLAEECVSKGVQVLLGPTINLQRHPLGGRHFECYAEDPILTADLAVAYVKALQARGIAATIKHFVANDSEFERHTISSEVDDHVLRSLYLVPFEEAVIDGGAWAVMSSYNRINGTYAAEHEPLLNGVLRSEWHFDGLVVSDWFGAQSTAPSALAGLDLEMPGPPIHYGKRLEAAVAAGEVPEEVIAERARRVIQLAERTGALAGPGQRQEGEDLRTLPERRELSRRLAIQSFVLLRNEAPGRGAPGSGRAGGAPLLPLDLPPGALLAVIGPNAATTATQGGGSARVSPEHTVSVLEGVRGAYAPMGVEIAHEIGCVTWAETPDLDVAFGVQYFALAGDGAPESSYAGPMLHEERTPRPPLLWLGDPVPQVPSLRYGAFAVRCSAEFTAELTGRYELSLAQAGSARLFVDGALVVEGSGGRGKRLFGFGSEEATGAVELEQGVTYEVLVEYEVTPGTPVAGLFVGVRPPLPGDDELIARAVALAGRADAVVCVVGTTAEWETEGHDRSSMDLPGRQDDLVRAVATANPRTAVLVNTGSPVSMGWAELPASILQIWFGGEAVGTAVADVLRGADEPGGRLPHTIPVRLEDTPAFPYYPGAGGKVTYGEGLFVGHRHYATTGTAPRYWFGHGLGYTSFTARDGVVEVTSAGARVSATVTNTGARRGSAVLQAYLAPVERADTEPALQFMGASRRALEPNESAPAVIEMSSRRLGRLRPGRYRVLSGWSADPASHEVAGEITVEG